MTEPALGQELRISYGDEELAVDKVGARLRTYVVDGQAVLETSTPAGTADVYKGAHGNLLMPWPNRVANGKYEFEGTELQLPINEVSRGHASHGFCRVFEWDVIEHSDFELKLKTTFHAQIGFPFVFDSTITYTLSDAGLRVNVSATNIGSTAMPFGVGMHPYLTADSQSRLTVPANKYDEVNEVMIPIGESQPVDNTPFDLRKSRIVAELSLDTSFTDLIRDPTGRCNVVLSRGNGSTTRLWLDEAYEYIMVYNGSKPNSVAIEPMSCAPDAFNNKRGLRVLQPDESFVGSWGIVYEAI